MTDYFLDVRSPMSTKTISGSTSSAAQSLTADYEGPLEVYNSTAAVAFVATAASGTATATTASYPIPPGQARTLDKGKVASVAAILSTGTGSVYVTELTGQ